MNRYIVENSTFHLLQGMTLSCLNILEMGCAYSTHFIQYAGCPLWVYAVLSDQWISHHTTLSTSYHLDIFRGSLKLMDCFNTLAT